MPRKISEFDTEPGIVPEALILYSNGSTRVATAKDLLQLLSRDGLGLTDLEAIRANLGAAQDDHGHDDYLPLTGGTMSGGIVMNNYAIVGAADVRIGSSSVMHTGRNLNEIGCPVYARSGASSAIGFGALVSGFLLRPSDSSGHNGAGTLSGTWRCLGDCLPGNSCFFGKVAN